MGGHVNNNILEVKKKKNKTQVCSLGKYSFLHLSPNQQKFCWAIRPWHINSVLISMLLNELSESTDIQWYIVNTYMSSKKEKKMSLVLIALKESKSKTNS